MIPTTWAIAAFTNAHIDMSVRRRIHRSLPLLLVAVLAAASATAALGAPDVPATLEGLVKVKSKKLDAVYLLPDADFRPYPKVMIDPVQVSFHKDWTKSASRAAGASGRIDEDDARRIADAMRSGFEDIFAAAFKAKGYEIAAAPGRDVLRLSPAVVNLYINAPAPAQPGLRNTYAVEAGEATLVLQVRDSTTGALLGVALDRSATRNFGVPARTTDVSSRADFEDLFRRWAQICVNGLDELKSRAAP